MGMDRFTRKMLHKKNPKLKHCNPSASSSRDLGEFPGRPQSPGAKQSPGPGGDAGLGAGTGLLMWGPPQTHGTPASGSCPTSALAAQTVPAAKAHTFTLEQLPPAQADCWMLGKWGRQRQWGLGAADPDLYTAFSSPQKDKEAPAPI